MKCGNENVFTEPTKMCNAQSYKTEVIILLWSFILIVTYALKF